MVCPKCTYEFCWDCLDHMPGYTHDYGEDCPSRVVVMYGQMGLLISIIFYRILGAFILSILPLLS